MNIKNDHGFFTVIALLLAAALVGVLYFTMFSKAGTQPHLDRETKNKAAESRIDTSSYKSILDTTKSEVKRIEQLQMDEAKKLDLYQSPDAK